MENVQSLKLLGYSVGGLMKIIPVSTKDKDGKQIYLGYAKRLDAGHPAHLLIKIDAWPQILDDLNNGRL